MAYADCVYRRSDVGHGVVDCQTGCYGTAWRIYVEGDGFVGAVGFEEEELGYYAGGEGFVDGAGEGDDAFFEEAGEDVVCDCGERF